MIKRSRPEERVQRLPTKQRGTLACKETNCRRRPNGSRRQEYVSRRAQLAATRLRRGTSRQTRTYAVRRHVGKKAFWLFLLQNVERTRHYTCNAPDKHIQVIRQLNSPRIGPRIQIGGLPRSPALNPYKQQRHCLVVGFCFVFSVFLKGALLGFRACAVPLFL